ncbi:NAC domain-containing protein 2-like [Coffea eugenioides]|nr:NAC domain-containing protein 2-like [Coffea eugenioides]
METQPISSFQFPPGVRFYPSDEELIVYYLHNKVNSRPLPAAVVGEIELYSYNPWDLPKKALFGEEEWYFFSPRDRKYPNGARPNRTAASGYWKATGTDKPILSCSGARIGVKKALVFYIGKPPNGVKTDWIMIEYRLPDTHKRPSRSKGSMRLDDWVLCRIRQKGNMSKNSWEVPHSPIKVTEDTPNLKELHSAYAAKNALDICSSYFLSKDCHLLAKLLATQDLPRIETNTRATSCSSNISQNCKTVYEHGTIKENQVTNSFFPSSLNQQGKPIEEIGYGNIPPSEKAMTNLNKNEFFLAGNVNGASFYNQQQSHGDMFKLNLSSAMMTLQELDVSAFAAKLLP